MSSIVQFNKTISGSSLKELRSPEIVPDTSDSRQCFCDISVALPFIFSEAKGTKRDTALLLPLVPLKAVLILGRIFPF